MGKEDGKVTVDELVKELTRRQIQGYGDAPVMLMNLNIQELLEAEEVNLLGVTERWQRREIEIR